MNKVSNSNNINYQKNSYTARERRKSRGRRGKFVLNIHNIQSKKPLFLLLIALFLGMIIFIFSTDWSSVLANRVFYIPGSSVALATVNPQATATATPFQPNIFTDVTNVQSSHDVLDTSNQLSNNDISGTSQQKIIKQSGQVYIVLLGSDQRQGENGFRTDEIIFLSINSLTYKVSVISFPRDLYVNVPGWEMQRINVPMGNGGFELLADTLDINFGIRPDFYMMTNFWSFVETVDNLGGLEISVPEYLEDKCEPPKTGICSVNAGDMIMDGETALWYVRSRRTTSDFDRTKRGREVLKALFLKIMRLDAVTHFPELYETYQKYIETNMKIDDMLSLLPVATTLVKDPDRIQFYSIGSEEVENYYTPAGAQVLLPDFSAIHAILVEALSR